MATPSWKDTKPWQGNAIGSWKDEAPFDPQKYQRTPPAPKVVAPIAPSIKVPEKLDTNPYSVGNLWGGLKQAIAHPFDSISNVLKSGAFNDLPKSSNTSMRFEVSDEALNKIFPGRKLEAKPLLSGPRLDPTQGISGLAASKAKGEKRLLTNNPQDVVDYQKKLDRKPNAFNLSDDAIKTINTLDSTVGRVPETIIKGVGTTVGATVGTASAVTSGVITLFADRSLGKNWRTTYLDVVKNAKEGFDFGFETGKGAGELATNLPVIGTMFAYALGKGAYDIGTEIGKTYEDAKIAGSDSPGLLALEKGLKENSSQGWQLLGAGKNEADEFVENPFLASLGMISYWGSAYVVAKGGAKSVEKGKVNIKKLNEKLTKDFNESFTVPENVSISAEKIQSIFNPNGREAITPQELAFIKDVSGKSAMESKAFYSDAIRNGVEVKIPVEKIITMVDKPYWGRIKDFLSIERTNKEVSRTRMGDVSKTPPLQIGGATGMPVGVTQQPVDPFASLAGEVKQTIEAPIAAPIQAPANPFSNLEPEPNTTKELDVPEGVQELDVPEGVQELDVPEGVQELANKEWEDNPAYGDKVGELYEELYTLEQEYKVTKDPALKIKIDDITNNIQKIQDEFVAKWQEAPVLKEKSPVLKEKSPVLKEKSPVLKEKSPVLKEKSPTIKATTKPIAVEEAVSKIVEKKNNKLPILQQFSVKDGKAYATDLEIGLTLNTKLEPGMYKLVGKEAVKATEWDQTEFPEIPKFEGKKIMEINSSELASILKKSNISKGKDDVRPELGGVSLKIKDGVASIAATDAYRLYTQSIPIKGASNGEWIIKNTNKLEKVLSSLGDDIVISVDAKNETIKFTGKNGEAVMRLIDGAFPDIQQIIPAYKMEYTFDKKELATAFKTLKPFAVKGNFAVDIIPENNKVTFIAESKKEGTKKEITINTKQKAVNTQQREINDGITVMPIVEGQELTLNASYVIDALNSLDGNNVSFYFNESGSRLPVFFTDKKLPNVGEKVTKAGDKTIKGKGIRRADEVGLSENLSTEVKTTASKSQLITPLINLAKESASLIEFTEKAMKIMKDNPAIEKVVDQMGFEMMKKNPEADFSMALSQIYRNNKSKLPTSQPKGGLGSAGDYAKINTNEVDIARIKTPELYRFVKSINADFPIILKNMRKFLGVFRGNDIAFSRKLFERKKDETPIEYQDRIAKTFAHEIGHFIDYLPDGTTKRGNLIGRLLVVDEFKKNFIDDVDTLKERKKLMQQINKNNNDPVLLDSQAEKLNEPLMKRLKEIDDTMTFNNPRFRAELLDITKTLQPWTEGVNAGYDSYRKSSVELYAEFVSALFTEPKMAETKAPTFFKEFFNSLDKKPAVQEALIGIQAEINGDRASLMKARWATLKESGMNAQGKYMTMLDEAANNNKKPWLQKLKRDAWYQHYWAGKVSKKAEYLIEEMDRGFNNSLYIWANKELQPIFKDMKKAGITSNDVDVALKLERIANDETRADVANSKGFDKMTAEEVLADLEATLGKEKATAILDASKRLRKTLQEVQLKYPDLWTAEQKALIESNEFYAPFNVLYNESTSIGYYIKESKGNIDKDFNVVENLLLRAKSVINFGEKNVLKKQLLNELVNDAIKAPKNIWKDDKGVIHSEFKKAPKNMGLVELKREGKLEGYYLPEDIAISLNQDNITELGIGYKLMRGLNKPFKKLYTELNVGFQLVNFLIRDWGMAATLFDPTWIRAQKGLSNKGANIIANNTYRVILSRLNQSKYYLKALTNLKEKNLFQKYTPIVEEGLKNHVIEVNGAGMYKIDHDVFTKSDEAAVKYILQSMGLFEKGSKASRIMPTIEGIGQTLEETPKLALFMYLKDQGILNEQTSQQYNSIIRNYVGSPNFWKQAKANREISSGFFFYNPIIRGMENLYKKAFVKDAVGKSSRSAFWYRMIRRAIIPALVGVAAEEGYLGDELKKKYMKLSSYLKHSYINIPLNINDDGTLTSISIPMDEDARMVYAMTQMLAILALHSDDKKAVKNSMIDIISYTGGQIPSPAPIVKVASAWNTVLNGGNYYDKFYGQNVLLSSEEKLPMSEKAKIMFKWTLNQNGQLKLNVHDGVDNKTIDQKILSMTPGINRFVRRTNSGEYEEDQKIAKQVAEKQAVKLLEKNEAIVDMVEKINKKEPVNIGSELDKLVKERLGSDASDVSEYNKEIKLLATALQERYIKSFGNVHYRSLLNANNEQKVAIILNIFDKNMMRGKELSEFITTAHQLKILSDDVVKELNKEFQKR